MFDIGFSELVIVFVVGLLILGPERLPHAAKTAGLWVRKIRRSIGAVQREINAQLDQEELQQKITATNKRLLEEANITENKITSSADKSTEKQPVETQQEHNKDNPKEPLAAETDSKA